MFDRNILTMVTKIAPFISFDKDPYPVIANKKYIDNRWIHVN